MITVFFCAGPVTDYATAKSSDTKRFGRFFHAMLDRGVYLPPAQFEAAFVSLAHGESEIDQTTAAAAEAFRAVAGTA
jgi:glutamate-1-semialdehyde 2,1-aminomutase